MFTKSDFITFPSGNVLVYAESVARVEFLDTFEEFQKESLEIDCQLKIIKVKELNDILACNMKLENTDFKLVKDLATILESGKTCVFTLDKWGKWELYKDINEACIIELGDSQEQAYLDYLSEEVSYIKHNELGSEYIEYNGKNYVLHV